jgi:putative Ca2+/H+ antiporter (TMEM165/GDT1 family)
MENRIINIIGGVLLILLGSVLILDVLTYKYSKAFAHQNFSGWLMGITYIIVGIYMIINSLFG